MDKKKTLDILLGILIGITLTSVLGYFLDRELSKTRASLLLYEAHDLIKQGDTHRAVAKLNQSVGLFPSNDIAHFTLAETYERLGMPLLALDEYEVTKSLCSDCYHIDRKISSLRNNKTESK